MKIKTLFIILISINLFSFATSDEKKISINFKINEDLITNYDIIKEAKYLLALNEELNGVNESQLLQFAQNSLIKEKIKQYEIEKFYEINYEASAVDIYLENFMKELNISNSTEFENYLQNYETNIKEVRKKLVIEQTWNKMIIDIYKDRISIDKKKISEELDEIIKKKGNQKSYELFEIVFSEKKKDDFEKKYDDIKIAINDFGFEKAALLFSISNTASSGGKIGWVNQNQLSEKILNEILNLDKGTYTKPINTAGGALILKINDIKEVSVEDINQELELSKIINAEKNRQLNEFSVIHYKKTESKAYVKKF